MEYISVEVPITLTTDASFQFEQLIEKTADAIAANVDIDRLLEVCRQAVLPEVTVIPPSQLPDRGLSIAVARDEAFTFTYKENIARLEQMGTVTYFSPIKDQTDDRSEERRVGKECRSRWSPYH